MGFAPLTTVVFTAVGHQIKAIQESIQKITRFDHPGLGCDAARPRVRGHPPVHNTLDQ
jgi:hypothetical protein